MRSEVGLINDVWNAGGPFIGALRPIGRVTVEADYRLERGYVGSPSKQPVRWFQRAFPPPPLHNENVIGVDYDDSWWGNALLIEQGQGSGSGPRAGAPSAWPDPLAWWVWPSVGATITAPVDTGTAYFRKTFTVGADTTAIISATADNIFDLYLDGVHVLSSGSSQVIGDTPAWNYTFSNTVALSAGEHLIAIRARNLPHFSTQESDSYLNPAGMIATVISGATVLARTDSTWLSVGNLQVETEVPNVRSITIDRSLDTDAGSCEIAISNQWMRANTGEFVAPPGSTMLRDEPPDPNILGDPGFFSPQHGYSAEARTRWGQSYSTWSDLLVPNALLRTYQGFGGAEPMTIPEALDDGNLVLTGLWLVDEVRIDTKGQLSLRCRDMAKLLIEQQLYPPLVPKPVYPLRYCRWEYKNETRTKVVESVVAGGEPGDRTLAFDTSANYAWYSGGGLHGHHPRDAFDGNQDSFYLSVGNSGPEEPYAVEWVQATCDAVIDTVWVSPWAGNYTCYVSVMVDGAWVDGGGGNIPYREAGVGRYNGAYEARIPYVTKAGVPWESPVSIKLPTAYRAQKVRFTFTNLAHSQWGPYPYRAGARELRASLSGAAGEGANQIKRDVQTTTEVVRYDGNYCVDAETEVLTPRGWLCYDEVSPGDEALALDPETGTAGWEVITDVFREHRQTPMVAMTGRLHDSLSTPDHRWITRDIRGAWSWKQTATLNTASRIPTAAPRRDAPVSAKYDDDFIELIAWFYTEGSLSDGRACLSQSKSANPSYAARIERSLRSQYGPPGPLREGALWNEQVNPSGTLIYRVSHLVRSTWTDVAPDRVPTPEFLCSLTSAQLILFIETSIDADGHRRLSNGCALFAQKDERRIRAFEMACVLAGRTPNTTAVPGGWSCTVRRRDVVAPCARPGPGREVAEVDYDGIIWCPTLRHHNWLARRNGKVYFTGNTDFSDIVRDLLLWSGWWLKSDPPHTERLDVLGNIESTGTYSEVCFPDDMFDKRPVIDAITSVKEAVGYIFWVDEDGGARFESPNWWSPGNFIDGAHIDTIPEIDEKIQLTDYSVSYSDTTARSEIIIASADPYAGLKGTLVTRYVPPTAATLKGMVKPAMWKNGIFTSAKAQRIMGELIAMHIWFQQRQGSVTAVANPLLQINDQVRIFERMTGETFVHYVRGMSTQYDAEAGDYTMTLTTHWLGDGGNWAVQ